MRAYYLLISLAALLAISAASMVFHLQRSRQVGPEDLILIRGLLKEYRAKTAPQTILNFRKLYPDSLASALSYQLPRNWPLGRFASQSLRCAKYRKILRRSGNSIKENTWNWTNCGIISGALPDDFFDGGNIMDASGNSYAYLAYSSGDPKYTDATWLMENITAFHITELSKVDFDEVELNSDFTFLTRLPEQKLLEILRGNEAVQTSNNILFRWHPERRFFAPDYFVYELTSLSNFLSGKSYFIETSTLAENCLYKQGSLCWKRDLTSTVSSLGTTSQVLLLGLIGLVTSLLWVLIKTIKREKLESEKRRFALEVLSHEFRTPVTNLILQIDRLNKMYSDLPAEVQEISPIIASDVYRLQRLAEETKQYLSIGRSDRVIDLKPELIPSINDFVQSYTDLSTTLSADLSRKIPAEVFFQGLQNDRSIQADSYWLGLCIKNLLANARQHGASPIHLSIKMTTAETVSISVKDAGHSVSVDIKKMTEPFFKGRNSQGMGLGLNLVKKIVKEMNGQLTFTPNPTIFTLTLKT